MPQKYIIHPLTGERVQVGVMRIIGCRPSRQAVVVVHGTRETFTVATEAVEYVFPAPYKTNVSLSPNS